MSVEFEENTFNPRKFDKEPTPKIAAWLISKGLAKDVASANKLQVVVALVFLAIAVYVWL
ncbi:hypothetical protein KW799_00490 [Candidatus Parcubacteria bacterium]|nr:hypothetical protein [Candidatus Parcubacteria bacterium]